MPISFLSFYQKCGEANLRKFKELKSTSQFENKETHILSLNYKILHLRKKCEVCIYIFASKY